MDLDKMFEELKTRLAKLKAYEESGLTPEEAAEIAMFKKKGPFFVVGVDFGKPSGSVTNVSSWPIKDSWINVKKQLPKREDADEDCCVLVLCKDGVVNSVHYTNVSELASEGAYRQVTHWAHMLPKSIE